MDNNNQKNEPARATDVVRCFLILLGLLGLMALPMCLALPRDAAAAEASTQPREVTQGSLLLRADAPDRYIPAPTLHTDVAMDVTAMIARVTVRQRFRNPSTAWAEGVYVFPLPETAAVDRLRMRIGERIIEGQIKEREEAKKTYEQAKQAGQAASLVEQERPNIFTTSVANIAPGGEVTVEIEYQQDVSYRDRTFSLRFPMVVGPRYIPGTPLMQEAPIEAHIDTFGNGWAMNTDQVPDASRITPPVRHPTKGPINPVSLTVRLNPGFALERLESPYHRIDVQAGTGYERRITLADGEVPADRDFELVWRSKESEAPQAALFTENKDGAAYAMLMLMPPGTEALNRQNGGREVTFVIDTSGSMHGASITQAREALLLALDRLTTNDLFNVIQFNSVTASLFSGVQPATRENVLLARAYVSQLQAEGGTEMRPALELALQEQSENNNRLRQVIFLTDGAVGNEDELFRLIRERLGRARLFTVGIGSAPNSHFMRKAAQFGRGSFTYIGDPREVFVKMEELLRRLEYPALTDIRIDLPKGATGEIFPEPIPDLYLGEPVVVALRAPTLPKELTVQGMFGNRPWRSTVSLSGGQQSAGVAVLWAGRKIASLMDRQVDARDETERQTLRRAVIDTSLAHHLVSRYTSLVAVDVTPVRPAQENLNTHAMETNLPHGWSYEHVFGMPQTATLADLNLLLGILLLVIAGFAWTWIRKLEMPA